MFGAFIDESYDNKNEGLFVVAAVLGDGWRVMKGESLWREQLTHFGLPKFKASKVGSPEVVEKFARAISDSGLVACAVTVEQKSLRHRFSGSLFHKQYKESPYLHLLHELFVDIAASLKVRRSVDSVSFVCDENLRYRNILLQSYPELMRRNPDCATRMGSCSTATDEDCIPLQMADLVASEIRLAGDTWTLERTGSSQSLRTLCDTKTLWKSSFITDARLQEMAEQGRLSQEQES